MADQTIATGIRPVEIANPIGTLAQLYQLRGAQTENLLRQQQILQSQQQTRAIQAQAEQRNRDLQDDNTIKAEMGGPNAGAIGRGDVSSLYGKVSTDKLTKLAEVMTKQHKETALADAETLKNNIEYKNQAVQSVSGLMQMPEPDAIAHYTEVLQRLVDQHNPIAIKAQQMQPTIRGFDDLKKISAALDLYGGVQEAALKWRQEQDKAREATASADRARTQADVEAATANDTIRQAGFHTTSAEQDAIDKTAKTKVDQAIANATLADKNLLSPEQRQLAKQADDMRKLRSEEVSLQARKFAMEYGGDAVKGWAETLRNNPDAANEVPPALRTPVMQKFTEMTGLPFPKPLSGTAVDQERAGRNTLDKIPRIMELATDPEVANRLGPILGRLGSVEQRVGSAFGLSPEGERKAQELRTLMRYMVFSEGRAVLGGRLPSELMRQLETSSPNVNMSIDTLRGAMDGVRTAANEAIENADRQRFGGKSRSTVQAITPNTAPSAPPAPTASASAHVIEGPNGRRYRYKGSGSIGDLKNYTELRSGEGK